MNKNFRKSCDDLWQTYDTSKFYMLGTILGLALVLLDYYDIPLQMVYSLPIKLRIVILVGCMLLITIWINDNHFLDLIKIPTINPVDMIALIILVGSTIYGAARLWLLGTAPYINYAIAFSFTMGGFLAARIILRAKKYIEAEKKCTNLVDLKDLYDNNISRVTGMPILIQENDVNYDLFGRSEIIDRLYRSIIHCRPESSYVISLEGEWGCGKTTIINNVKQRLKINSNETDDIVIIDDFDPWLFGSQESLLLSMYDTLLQHVGLRYSPTRSNRMVKGIAQTVTENYTSGGLLYNLLHNSRHQLDDVQALKKRIGAYLKINNKRIVFFIDNLDRTNDDNIIFLFKLISIVFDLPGVVYILSFEKERINKILENTQEIDFRFTEKIIQQEIKIPAIGEEKSKSVYSLCMWNLLEAYGISGKEIPELTPALKYIIEQSQNTRMFKRVLNSVFPTVFCYDNILNKTDLLAITAIRFFDPDLYSLIYKNPKFFISHDKSLADRITMGFRKTDFNKQGADFFEELLKKHSGSKEILTVLFPYVKEYVQHGRLEKEHISSDPDAQEIAKRSRICSGKYFDLYFSHGSNSFLEIRRLVEQFVDKMNGVSSITEGISVVEKTLQTLKTEDHQEWVEQLQCHLSDVLPSKAFFMCSSIYASIYSFDDETQFLVLTPQSRTEYILSELLCICSKEEFLDFLKFIQKDYIKLKVIQSVIAWLKGTGMKDQQLAAKRAEILQQQYHTMCEKVLTENINIYSNENYHAKNAWALYHYCKDTENISRFTTYIMDKLSASTVYKIIWDVTSESIGNNYRYSIDKDNLKLFCNDEQVLKELAHKTDPQTDDELFVNKVYNAYIDNVLDVWGHTGITISFSKNLSL